MKNKPNENYLHDCGCEKQKIENFKTPVTKMGFTSEQLSLLLEFYVFDYIVKEPKGETTLKYYGWIGHDLTKLEGSLLKAANLSSFCIIKADTINETLRRMNLTGSICTEHPRAVLKMNHTVKLNEDGTVNISTGESRMECLFRHIRNSLAHNMTYLFQNDNILLNDMDIDSKNTSASILIPKQALLSWISIIKKE